MKNAIFFGLFLTATALLTSCQTYISSPNVPTNRAQNGLIDGDWIDTRGINTVTFSKGTFTSTDSATYKILARGSYKMIDTQKIDLIFTSLLRNTTVNATCLRVTPSQLNCTTSTSAQFTLVKKALTP